MKGAKYKIVEVNGFWRFQIYKRALWRWRKICGRDDIRECEQQIRASAIADAGLYYDAAGRRIGDTTIPGAE